jgi:enoyl-CoA hydratase/carnithine racemase
MLNPKSFLYEQQDGIGTITLNRPDRLNAITFEVYHELTDFMAQLRDEKGVRVRHHHGRRSRVLFGR